MAEIPEDLHDAFVGYVQNDIPLRLISIPDFELVDRNAVQEFYLPRMESITESTIKERLSPKTNRETVVSQLVREAVQYAILSHRWLPKEPTFRDLVEKTASGCGLEKLKSFCEAAESRGIRFAWSDTCCIDKSSSSELDEAIRSMFRWYRNSTVCIVYLAQTQSLSEMKHDEWFDRGWTLQEMLAPRASKFFNTDWLPLTDEPNDKNHEGVLRACHIATGCPIDGLRDFRPGPFNVDRRMTWAARRKTTRAEDVAYSLMGIFDVIIQPAYGEGAERSFCRLVEMIMQSNGNASTLNWAGKAASSYSSSALPSSPRCYEGHHPTNSIRKFNVKMTGRGLEASLVILPLTRLQTSKPKPSVVRAEFCIADSQLRKETDTITIDVPATQFLNDVHYALGVYNYLPPYGNHVTGQPALRRLSTAYLLVRRKAQEQSRPVARPGLMIHDDLRFYGWKKVTTVSFVHFVLKGLWGNKVMTVDEKLLEVVHI